MTGLILTCASAVMLYVCLSRSFRMLLDVAEMLFFAPDWVPKLYRITQNVAVCFALFMSYLCFCCLLIAASSTEPSPIVTKPDVSGRWACEWGMWKDTTMTFFPDGSYVHDWFSTLFVGTWKHDKDGNVYVEEYTLTPEGKKINKEFWRIKFNKTPLGFYGTTDDLKGSGYRKIKVIIYTPPEPPKPDA